LSNEISDRTRFRPAQKLPARNLAGETVMVDPRQRKVFLMNTVGGVVWEGVERGASAGEIRAEVIKRFRVTDEQAALDIARFFQELEAAGLVERAP
jgi:hypothetical protein